MKIVVLDGYAFNPGDLSWDGFDTLGDLTVYDRTPREDTISRIGDAEVIIVNKTSVTKEVLDACPRILYIGVLATGYNVVDTDAAKEKGIPVTNVPTYGTMAVAQFTMALLLEIAHHVGDHSRAVYKGEWTGRVDFTFWKHPLFELEGKTMGIIGFGRIGQQTATVAKAFGLNILACNPTQDAKGAAIATYVSLEELLQQSDIISLHCPLFPETKGIICKETIAQMKKGVIILNTSRGPLIVEEDLASALNSGKVAYAAVDVVSKEPIRADNPLLFARNCIITPHIAWAPVESRARLMTTAVDNLRHFIDGTPQNVVNPS